MVMTPYIAELRRCARRGAGVRRLREARLYTVNDSIYVPTDARRSGAVDPITSWVPQAWPRR